MALDKPPIDEILVHYGAANVPPSHRYRPIKCPFHEDRQASASVSTDLGKFKCFACDINGDGIDLIQWKEGYDFASAVRFAEEILGRSVGDLLPGNQKRTRRNRLSEEPGNIRGQRTIVSSRRRRKPLAGA